MNGKSRTRREAGADAEAVSTDSTTPVLDVRNTALESRVVAETEETVRQEGLSIAASILVRVAGMTVASKEEYIAADAVLGRLRDKRLYIMNELINRLKKPINEAHDRVLALEHELVDPLASAEKALKNKMGLWTVQERRRIQEAADADRRERERVEAEQRRVQEAADRAQQAGKLSQAHALRREALELADQAEELGEKAVLPVQVVGQAARSNAVAVKRWRVKDLRKVLQGILNGETPEGIVQVNAVMVNQYMRGDQTGEVVGSWPGMEVYDDVQIRGKG